MGSSRLRVTANISQQKLLIIEPWAHEIELELATDYDLIADAAEQPWFEVESLEDCLIIYVNGNGSTYKLLHKDKIISESNNRTPYI
ncbi:hypothetical protein D8779_20390 [Pseudomonas leptonychotis]|uniref:Uncharacterized protein n=1 Tax=Pseudomonas leptonychotis TaxID=2448482 RepID=A0A4T1ZPX2_9PSED|nr:hypothetical protein D8779_20390 [Pseudomonas leptonychotis]